MADPQAIDTEKVKALAEQVFAFLGGTVISGMIYLGDRMGLYQALQKSGPLTSAELANHTGLNERWLREWLQGQAAARLLDYQGNGRFAISPEAALVLANENSPAFIAGGFCALPQWMAVLEQLPESFKSGLGLPYDAFGPEGARGVERLFAPWFRTQLVPVALPRLDGVVAKLEAGAKIADIGCGSGVALVEMAKAFPRSAFHGYDISTHALARAEAHKVQSGVQNVTFHNVNGDALPEDRSFDFITTFDCIHDMPNPDSVIGAIRKAIRHDGTWLIADIHGKGTFEENLAENPIAGMMYAFSVLSCLSSSLSVPGGAGLGTLGFSEPVARQMTAAAGFTRFQVKDFDNPFNAYYEVRP